MTLTLELDDSTSVSLERAALASGESPLDYVRKATVTRLGREQSSPSSNLEERSRRIDDALDRLKQSGASLGRNGRPWREFFDEGRKW